MIYAFKKGDRVQTLDEHIEKCLNTLSKIRNSKLWHEDFDYELVKKVIVFHDIGKVFYQRDSDSLSFTGHEFISAYIFWKVFGESLTEENLELMYLFPIIFHHHAMKIRGRGGRKGRLDALKTTSIVSPNSEIIHELEKILEKYTSQNYVTITINVLRSLETLKVVNLINKKIDAIWRKFHQEFAKKSLRLLLIMIICDYEGSKDRGTPTSFGKIIEGILKLYT